MAGLVIRPENRVCGRECLRDGQGKMQGFAFNDNRSWVFWASYHGLSQFDCWHHARGWTWPRHRVQQRRVRPCIAATSRASRTSRREITRNAGTVLPRWTGPRPPRRITACPGSYTDPDVGGHPNHCQRSTPDIPDARSRRTPSLLWRAGVVATSAIDRCLVA